MTNNMRGYTHLQFTCFEAGLENVAQAIKDVLKIKEGGGQWNEQKCNLDERAVYFPASPKGIMYKFKFMLWEPMANSGTTIFLSNVSDGWATLTNIVAEKYKFHAVRISLTEELLGEDQYNYLSVTSNGKLARTIAATVDGKWQFTDWGEPLWFEDLAHYKKRRIKDRLNYPIVRGYLHALGWDMDSDGFWQSPPGRRICFEEVNPPRLG
jgi:hypothetical protein